MSEVYLRQVDPGTPNACWVVCAKGDPGAVAHIPQTPTARELLRRLDTVGELSESRLIVMAQNTHDFRWTKALGQFTADEVRAALRRPQ